MRNLILSALSAGFLFASAPATPVSASVAADINLHFGDAPRVYFARPPRTVLIPETQVYYVEGTDYDMFQCDGSWYVDNGGYWYRAPSYRGPFVSVSFQSVPRQIIALPSAYAHQPYRPGVWRSDSRRYGYGTSYRSGQSNDNRNWQDSDQRWQDRQGWQRSGQNNQGNRGDQGNGNRSNSHGRGRGNGNGHGRGRGHDN